MLFYRKWYLFTFLFTIMIYISFLPGFAAKTLDQKPFLRGWVFTDNPIVGADVEVIDSKGKSLLKTSKVTNEAGAFAFEVKGLPANFRVIVSGGTCEKSPFDAKLMADFRDFDVKNSMVYVNPVTSIASILLDNKKSLTPAAAAMLVRKALEIPDHASIGIGLQVEQDFFSPVRFVAEAQKSGGLTKFITDLAKDAAAGKHHTFAVKQTPEAIDATGQKMPKGLRSSATTFIAKGLGNGVLAYIGGAAFGKGLDAIGLGDTSMQEMKQMMAQISAQLVQLQAQLSAVQQQIRVVDYNVLASQLNFHVSSITTAYEALRVIGTLDPSTDYYKNEKAALQKTIRNTIMLNEDAISNAMLGIGLAGGEGMIKKWSKAVAGRQSIGRNIFFSPKDSKLQIDMFDYWDRLQAMQLDLIVSYLRSMNAPQSEIKRHMDKFMAVRDAQIALAPTPLPDWVLVCQSKEKKTDIMIRANYLANPYCWNNYDRACEVLKEVNANSNWGLGFSDWRLPDYDGWKSLGWGSSDIRAMFDEGENGDYREQAIARGWPEEWLKSGHMTFWVDNTFRKNNHFIINQRSCWSFDAYGGGYIHNASKGDVNSFMPIRDLKAGEIYFYKD